MKKGTALLKEPAYTPVQGGHIAPLVSLKTWKTDPLFYISFIVCLVSMIMLSVANEIYRVSKSEQVTATTSFAENNSPILPVVVILSITGTCLYLWSSTTVFYKLTRLPLISYFIPSVLLIIVMISIILPNTVENSDIPKFEIWAEQRYGIVVPQEQRTMENDKYFIYNTNRLAQYHLTPDNRWLVYGENGKELPLR